MAARRTMAAGAPARPSGVGELGHDLARLLTRRSLAVLWRKAQADDVPGLTAEITYYSLFALFPFLLLIGSLAALLIPSPDRAIVSMLLLFHRFLPAETAELLTQFVATTLNSQRPDLLSIGILGTLWACSQGITAVLKALNRVYGSRESRSWWHHRALALLMALGAALVAIMLVLLMLGADPGGVLSRWLALPLGAVQLWGWLRWPIAFAMLTTVLAFLYCKGPCRTSPWQWITPGGFAASVLWLVLSAGLTAWVDEFGRYNATYGVLGGVIVLLIWLYLGAFLLLLGAEANVVLARQADEDDEALTPRP